MTGQNFEGKMYHRLILTNSHFHALVDDEDLKSVFNYSWHLTKGGYAARSVSKTVNGKRQNSTIFLHRVINKTPAGRDTDHINGDKLDNRRKNLRSCLHLENTKNRTKSTGKSSRFKGVSWHKGHKKWQASIRINYKQVYIGIYPCEKQAARAYNSAATKHHGKFAKTN